MITEIDWIQVLFGCLIERRRRLRSLVARLLPEYLKAAYTTLWLNRVGDWVL